MNLSCSVHLQLNPQHCIPTLDDNELVLWESRVILTYLASMYEKDDDKLYPKDVRIRALVDQRLHFDLGTLYQRTFEYFVSSCGETRRGVNTKFKLTNLLSVPDHSNWRPFR